MSSKFVAGIRSKKNKIKKLIDISEEAKKNIQLLDELILKNRELEEKRKEAKDATELQEIEKELQLIKLKVNMLKARNALLRKKLKELQN